MDNVKPIPWRGFSVLDKLLVVLLLAMALGVAILPFLDPVLIRRIARQPGMRAPVTWLVNDYGSWIVSFGLLALLVLFLYWKRRQLVSDRRLWFGTGCPNCLEHELVRVSRVRGDRLYGLAGIPAYRYACRNCTWRGLRIARREHSPELDAALEEALLRFDPNDPKPREIAALNAEPDEEPFPLVVSANGDEERLPPVVQETGESREMAETLEESWPEEGEIDSPAGYLNLDDQEIAG